MIEWSKLTNEEIRDVDRRLPVVIPVGLVEAHGPHLSLGLDNDTAAYFSLHIAKNSGAVLMPLIPYGFADAMKEYPGTVGVTAETLALIVRDVSNQLCSQGFMKQIYLSGHGANKLGCELGFYKVWESYPDFKPAYWNWWTESGMENIHHADKGETEAALAVGSVVHMDRVKDYQFTKPWFKVRSRFQYDPDSGGINGFPSQANTLEAEKLKTDVIKILSSKILSIADENN